MPAPNPLQFLNAFAHPLGQEIDLAWTLPSTLPSGFKVVVFRKQGSDVTQQDIDDHFAGSTPQDVTVWEFDGESDGTGPNELFDLFVEDGETYYYKVVVQDTSDDTYSTALGANAVPASTVTTSIVDAKEEVVKLIERIMTNYGMTKVKDYELKKEYALEGIKTPTIFVTRADGSVLQRFLGQIVEFDQAQQLGVYGDLDLDNIQVTWEDPSSERRDKITNIFRESREAMRRYLGHPDGAGMVSVDIIIQGDAINTAVKDRLQISGMMLISCGIQTESKFVEDVDLWVKGEATFEA